jgi:hypothetical protein
MGNLKGRDDLKDLGRRWEDDFRMDAREIGWEVLDWIHMAQDRDQLWPVVNTVIGGEFLV